MIVSRVIDGVLPGRFAHPDDSSAEVRPLTTPPDPGMFREAERARYRILVVDDDPAIREFVSEFLAVLGFTVRTAANGAEALAMIAGEVPTLIMLDMRMPVMDGWQFATEVRRRGIGVPIVVMTAAVDAKQRATEIGAMYFLGKPFDFGRVVDFVDRLCAGWPEEPAITTPP